MFEISLNAHDALIMLSHENARNIHLSHAFSPQQTQPKCSCRGSFCDGLHRCVTSPSGILAGVASAMALETISAPLLTYTVLRKCHKSERQTSPRQQARLDNKQTRPMWLGWKNHIPELYEPLLLSKKQTRQVIAGE